MNGNKIVVKNSEVKKIVGGDDYHIEVHFTSEPNPDALIAALKRVEENPGADDVQEFIDALNYLTNEHPDSVIGLEGKLVNGGRQDLVEEGILRKDAFVKRICRAQLSPRRRYIYYYALQKIRSAFDAKVRSLIKAGSPHLVVDNALYEEVVSLIHAEICPSDVGIDQYTIYGMVYFLTGKCYLKWDA